MKARPR